MNPLSPLGDGPVPPLAPAATVRARGDQRRRRSRAAAAGGGAVAVALAFAGGYALVGTGGSDRDQVITTPATSAPSPEPSPSPSPSVAVEPSASTAATPSGEPSASAPSPSRAAVPASQLLLTVEDADRAEPGEWTREGQDVEGPLLDPCTGGTAYPRDADVVDSAVTELVARREAGGTSAVQTVARYASESAAVDAAQGYERAVRGCPVKQEPNADLPGNRRTHEVVDEQDVDGVPTLLVRSESTCDTCSSGYTYYAVQQVGDAVSVLLVAQGEDGDPGVDVVRPFAREAARALSR